MSYQRIDFEPIPETQNASEGKAVIADDLELISHVDVEVKAMIGSASVPIGKLFSLKQGDTLTLNESLDTPVKLFVNGRCVADAELVAVDDNFGIRVIELKK